MKIKFILTLEGKDTLKQKVDETFSNVPDMDKEVIFTLAKVLVLAFRLDGKDEVTVCGFETQEEASNVAQCQTSECILPVQDEIIPEILEGEVQNAPG